MPEFTLSAYERVINGLKGGGFRMIAVEDWLLSKEHHDSPEPVAVLRHDVDRRPRNALDMARLEANLGVRSSYYFRILPISFKPDIIREIAAMGHEIGYHYEDWDRAKRDPEQGIRLFSEALEQIRAIAPVSTVAMHGSPLAPESNLRIWEHASYSDYGVSDCLLSYGWDEFNYFTDAGRTFGQTSANLRDDLGNATTPPGIHTSHDLASYLESLGCNRVMISTHPERWSSRPVIYVRQWCWDTAANIAKRGLRLIRSR